MSLAQRTEIQSRTEAVIAEFRELEGPLLPILHGVQEEFGYVPAESLPVIASALNISNAEAHGVATFYHDYRSEPAGKHVIKVCQAEACQSMGSDRVARRFQELLGIGLHDTTHDGRVTLEPVYCLGLCSCAPAAMVDGEVHGRLDDDAISTLVAETRA